VDTKKEPLAYADVSILQLPDSSLVTGGIADDKGDFSLDAAPGNYLLSVEYLGFKRLVFPVRLFQDLRLGDITLKEDFGELEGVSFSAQRDLMELKLDKRIYNVDADLNNQGTNASEMLENIPSVTVDAEGNVSLRGNQSVRILIDGKYSGFASTADALKQLQTDRIERVEIITNASARYDAQGDAGIINIILKKNNKDGFNGSVNLRGGYFPEYGGGLNLNYRKNKFNYFLSYNINQSSSPANSTTYQRLRSADTSFTYRQLYHHDRDKLRHDGTLGMDYDINDRHTLSAAVNFRTGTGNNFYDRVYENLDAADILTSRDTRLEDNTEQEELLEATLTFKRKLKKKGGEWNTEVKMFRDRDFERSDYRETSTAYTESRKEKSHAFVTEQFFLFQSDYILPIGAEGKLETGVRSQWRNMDNDFGFSRLEGEHWEAPGRFNDRFNYDEKVHAAYLMGSNTFGKLGAQLGVRAEYSDITTEQASLASPHHKQYINFFPSAALSYKASETGTFQLSYSRRIQRPGQWDLMPFMKFGDNREMRIGNPDINPEFTDVIEGGWMQYFIQGSLLSSLYYRRTTDKIERMAEAGADGIIYRIPMNIAGRDATGLELNGSYNPYNWLRLTSGFNFFYQSVTGTYKGDAFRTDNFSWTNRTSVNITLPYRIRMQVSSNYQAPSVHPQGKTLAIFYGDFGLSKDLWKNNATIGVNVRDVLNSRRWKNETNTATIYAISDFQWRPRSIRLTFTYRFNQPNKETRNNRGSFDSSQDMEG